MLDAFIIEEIIRREEQFDRPRPSLRAPSPSPYEPPPPMVPERDEDEDDQGHDGVIIIDM